MDVNVFFRAVNNALLDTYQLKSLDGALESPVEELSIRKVKGRYHVSLLSFGGSVNLTHYDEALIDNFPMRQPYDAVIACLGFTHDSSIFKK